MAARLRLQPTKILRNAALLCLCLLSLLQGYSSAFGAAEIRSCSRIIKILEPLIGPRVIYEITADLSAELNQVQPKHLNPFEFLEGPSFRHTGLYRRLVHLNRRGLSYSERTQPWDQNWESTIALLRSAPRFNYVLHAGGLFFIAMPTYPPQFIDDKLSKHILLTGHGYDVRYAGSFGLSSTPDSSILDIDTLDLDGESGSFRPDRKLSPQILPIVRRLLLQGGIAGSKKP
jgi:hypothetical protein